MENEVNSPGTFYLFIHSVLKEKARSNYMSVTSASSFLFEWRIPKQLRPVILKELEQMNLIERVDRRTIKFNQCDIDIKDMSKVYERVGLFIDDEETDRQVRL